MSLRLQMVQQHVLATIRMAEARWGQTLAQTYRHPAAPRGTAPKLHKITDRHARKAAMRKFNPARPLNNFIMGSTRPLVPHRHASASV